MSRIAKLASKSDEVLISLHITLFFQSNSFFSPNMSCICSKTNLTIILKQQNTILKIILHTTILRKQSQTRPSTCPLRATAMSIRAIWWGAAAMVLLDRLRSTVSIAYTWISAHHSSVPILRTIAPTVFSCVASRNKQGRVPAVGK